MFTVTAVSDVAAFVTVLVIVLVTVLVTAVATVDWMPVRMVQHWRSPQKKRCLVESAPVSSGARLRRPCCSLLEFVDVFGETDRQRRAVVRWYQRAAAVVFGSEVTSEKCLHGDHTGSATNWCGNGRRKL